MKFKPSIIALTLVALMFAGHSEACTNYIVTKGASADGSVMMTYSADSHTLYGELYHWPSSVYPKGAMLDVVEWDTGRPIGQIKQVEKTYNVIGNMNENQVAIGESTFGGRLELIDTTGLVDYGSLIYIALQRSRTARQAIDVMTSLVAEYGYCSEGESFSIIDKDEAWIMEMIGKGPGNKGAVWVARRIPDGYVCGHANQSRISTFPLDDPENCLYSPDVIKVARERGWFTGKDEDFSFCDAYNPIDFFGARACDLRVWTFFNRVASGMDKYWDYAQGYNLKNRLPLWVKPDHKVQPRELMNAMRDHLEGTELDMSKDLGAGPFGLPYRWRPMEFELDGDTYVHERTTATQQTGWWFLAQARSWLPDQIGGIFWFGVDDTATSCLTPVYSSSTRVPYSYRKGYGDLLTYKDDAAFWVFTRTAQLVYSRYNSMIVDLGKLQDELEEGALEKISEIDAAASELLQTQPAKAVEFLTDFSVNRAEMTVSRWKDLYGYLLVKYSDGNIKLEKDGQFLRNEYGTPEFPDQPEYPEFWYRAIVRDHGEAVKAPK